MEKYNNSDYSARNVLVGHLQSLLKNDSSKLREDIKDLLEEFKEEENKYPLTAKHVKDAITELSKVEQNKGKKEMRIIYMSLDEIKKVYEKLIAIRMTPGPGG